MTDYLFGGQRVIVFNFNMYLPILRINTVCVTKIFL